MRLHVERRICIGRTIERAAIGVGSAVNQESYADQCVKLCSRVTLDYFLEG